MKPSILASVLLAFAAVTSASTGISIPVGEQGVSYEGLGVPEMLPYGPTALAVDPRGGFWVADAVARRLLRVDDLGSIVATIPLGSRVATITDLHVGSHGIAVLDAAADRAQVLRLDLDGRVRERILLPESLGLRAGLSGFARGLVEVVLELESGVRRHALTDATGLSLATPEPFAGAQVVPADWASPWPGRASIVTSAGAIVIESPHHLGAIRLLGTPAAGSVVVLVEEVSLQGPVDVDVTVRKLDVGGGDLRARLPRGAVHIAHPVAVGPDGRVFALVAGDASVEIRELDLAAGLESTLASGASLPVVEPEGDRGPNTCVSRTTMESNAWGYRENWKVLSSTNISGTCTGRTKPHYLGSPGNYRSVSYDWGGWDSVSSWNSYMTSGYKAGDINTAGVESCSKGVDCSGFVSRCWQTSQKYGTSTLPNISYQLSSTSSLKTGDILNKAGSHVVLVDYITSQGVWAWEATTGGYDRVIWNYNTWSRYSGYLPRRYNNVCP